MEKFVSTLMKVWLVWNAIFVAAAVCDDPFDPLVQLYLASCVLLVMAVVTFDLAQRQNRGREVARSAPEHEREDSTIRRVTRASERANSITRSLDPGSRRDGRA